MGHKEEQLPRKAPRLGRRLGAAASLLTGGGRLVLLGPRCLGRRSPFQEDVRAGRAEPVLACLRRHRTWVWTYFQVQAWRPGMGRPELPTFMKPCLGLHPGTVTNRQWLPFRQWLSLSTPSPTLFTYNIFPRETIH